MKKYLIQGALALSLGTVFISCGDKDIEYQSVADAKVQSFDENFRATFGSIAPDQDWGFGDDSSEAEVRTRYAQTEANMWGPSTEAGRSNQPYAVPAPLSQAQKDKVRDWFQTHNKPSGESLSWTDFFVQQVYKGGDSPTTSCPEVYTAKDGVTPVTGSNKMDYLTAGNANDHINNFNWGTYSNNSDTSIKVWNGTMDSSKGTDFNDQKVYYYDQIMLMRESSTSCFGYHESFIDKHYNDRFVIISGNTIDHDIPGGASVAGMYFVGFDFDADDTSKALSQQVDRDFYFSDWIVRITKGVLPSSGGSQGGGSSSSTTTTRYNETVEYRKKTTVRSQGRIICEDLGASTDSENNRRDIDYNDVVFDAYLITETYYTHYIKTKTTYVDGVSQGTYDNGSYKENTRVNDYAKIVLQAAGGTIPLTVAGFEVHSKFGVDQDVMVNTVNEDDTPIGRYVSGYKPVEYTVNTRYDKLYDIPVAARWGTEVIEIVAHEGGSPQKICVPINTPWCKERSSIDLGYPSFANWVKNKNAKPWDNKVQNRLYDRVPTVSKMTTETDELVSSNSSSSQQSSTTYNVSPSASEKIIWQDLSGKTVFTNNWDINHKISYNLLNQNDPQGKGFGVNSVIRAYVAVSNGFNVQMHSENSSNTWTKLVEAYNGNNDSHITNGNGYVEYTVTSTALEALKTGNLCLIGLNYRLLAVTIDNTNSITATSTAQEETTFTTPTLATGENSIYTSSNGVQLNSSGQSVSNGLSSAGENTEITVHGISDNGNISVTTSDGTALQSVSSSARTRAGSQVSYKFKVQSADVASKVRSGGIKVKLNSGSFKLYMVSAKIVTYTPSTPSTGGKVLYDIEKDGAVSTNGGKIYADASEFTNSAGKTLRIYCSNPQGGWDVEVRGKSWGDMNVAAWNNSNKANINTFPTAWDNGRDYLDIELTDTQASMLAREGMMITIYWITVTQVVLK